MIISLSSSRAENNPVEQEHHIQRKSSMQSIDHLLQRTKIHKSPHSARLELNELGQPDTKLRTDNRYSNNATVRDSGRVELNDH